VTVGTGALPHDFDGYAWARTSATSTSRTLPRLQGAARYDTNISTSNLNAWSENAGWMNFRALAGDYGVMVGNDCLRGYAWEENIAGSTWGVRGELPIREHGPDELRRERGRFRQLLGVCLERDAGWINFAPRAEASW